MKFSKIIGVSNNPATAKLILEAEEKLTNVILELSVNHSNTAFGSKLGGCPLVFQLVYPSPHICDITGIQLEEINTLIEEKSKDIDLNDLKQANSDAGKELINLIVRAKLLKRNGIIYTAATDGHRYIWNPEFVAERNLTGLRIVVMHEAWHSIFMHPSRRAGRLPILWNIAVDYRVNYTIMEDLKARNVPDYPKVFVDNLGDYISIAEYSAFLKDPFSPPEKMKHISPMEDLKRLLNPKADPVKDKKSLYFADQSLENDFRRPEYIYSHLLSCIPKCPHCGKLGKYKVPEEYKKLKKQLDEKNNDEKHNHLDL